MTDQDKKTHEKFIPKSWSEIKSENSWTIFKVMSEFVEGYEKLAKIGH